MFSRLLAVSFLLFFSQASPAQQPECPPSIRLPSDHAAYADAMKLARILREHGFVVNCIALSKEEQMFEGQEGAVFYGTNLGNFNVLFLQNSDANNNLKVTEERERGFYRYSFGGSPRSLFQRWEGIRPTYFVKHENQLLHALDRQLAIKLEEALGPAH